MRKPCCVAVKQDSSNSNNGASWSKQEDEKLSGACSRKHGEGSRGPLPQDADLVRLGKRCRLRWINHSKPDVRRGKFGEDEEDLIIKLHALLGNRWSLIAGRLPGRTDDEVKNYWNSHLRRKLLNMGIDPNNHRPGRNITNIQRLQNMQTSASATSATAINVTKGTSHGHVDENEQVSDAGSYSEDNDHDLSSSSSLEPALPDLNLDLTLGTSVSTDHIHKQGDAGRISNCNVSNLSSELDLSDAIGRSPTLLLFR